MKKQEKDKEGNVSSFSAEGKGSWTFGGICCLCFSFRLVCRKVERYKGHRGIHECG